MKILNLKFVILFTCLFAVFPVSTLAQEGAVKAPSAGMSEQSFFGNTLMFMVAGFLGYYMLVTRPEQLKDAAQKAIIDKIKKNDLVLVSPGIYGKVIQVLEGEVTVDIGTSGSSLKVKVLPSTISLPEEKSSEKSPTKN
jgi:preprotein translocase YajC subunit